MTYDNREFYIDGAWVGPVEPKELKDHNAATEEVAGVISMGSSKDVDRAVMAARRAFDSYSSTSPAERLALMERILAAYKAHYDEIAQAISIEMGAPITLSKGSQTGVGVGHISAMIEVLKNFKFEEMHGTVRLVQEPVGVCALQRHHLGQGHARGGSARRCVQPHQRRWRERRRAALLAPRGRHGVLYRIDARRLRSREERGRVGQARAPRARRQVAQCAAP